MLKLCQKNVKKWNVKKCKILVKILKPIQDVEKEGGRGGRPPPPPSPYKFSPCKSCKVEISHQNFLTFSCNPLPHLCRISRPYLVPVPNYETLTKTTPYKKDFFCFFLVKSLKNWGYENFSHGLVELKLELTRVTKLWSHDSIYSIIWVTW